MVYFYDKDYNFFYFLRRKEEVGSLLIMKKNILICDICLSRNYHIKQINRSNRLSLKKYCSQCKKHVLHEESI
ncbi:MAG: 50S ribosomal protein L33 [Candidatus Phytoplasma stylosanthis]|uniref:50S ribosomal protein L33 n=1 Tax=Candidatus Phytoplasma stylosanthis TaxID=2798314 RepID=UPI00293A1204|nr:50S ribosomal protein L33 [Candidatus Phytoplasma stylosanthis]MDV3167785.1 50S ribosomal protein L33 [Candidatus Phytoplasma stylosanthis]MDV3170938.1 50S ribosomal protein L33 [Candidatus Phytoplasma stylosanthis]MDV3173690.1 50S ribosomal protein L33 [Candidatus Phytoplasma stylosanthis]MDV3174110.1 50S ribosomal protein L33 [Candidatus Phytoplasma stylosanthis]MDV3202370.1 50S ribosomal protein L33 [Candidatus Phytoplasma stylosanthis]